MTRSLHSLFALYLAIFLLFFPGAAAAEEPGGALHAGVILPLSGKAASLGAAVRNGMMMAIEEVEKRDPHARSRLQFHFEDDGSESKNAIAAFQHLTQQFRLAVVVSAVANSGRVLVPLTERQRLPLISISLDHGICDGTAAAFTFFVSPEELAKQAELQARRSKYKRIALVTTQHEGNFAMRSALRSAFGGAYEFPFDEEAPLADNEFLSQIVRLRTVRDLDAIGALMHPAHLGTFAREVRRAGIRTPIFTLGGFEDLAVRKAAEGALDGQWYAAGSYSNDFLRRYSERFPDDSPYGAAYGHDVILLLARAASERVESQDLPAFFRRTEVTDGYLKAARPDGKNRFDVPGEVKIVGEDYGPGKR